MLNLSESQRRAALLGLLVGDAAGVPYEFKDAAQLPAEEEIEMEPPAGFRRSHGAVPPGTWSDDGAQALALLDSLTGQPHLSLKDFASCLLAWFERGEYTPDGIVFDVGVQTQRAFFQLLRGGDPHQSGGASENENGNGALMRALPCVLVPVDSEDALIERAVRQGLPTHGHVRSQVTCALYVLTAWKIAHDGLEPEAALHAAQRQLERQERGSAWVQELIALMRARENRPMGSGYVVDSFWSAWHAYTSTNSFRACVQRAIAFGRDTDTTACIAGGLAGLRYGEAGMPAHWLAALRGKDLALKLL